MPLNPSGLIVAGNALDAVILYAQAHSAAPTMPAGTGNTIGSRVAVNGTVDANGNIGYTGVAFTGLGASVAFWGVTWWTASTGGTCHGSTQRSTGDTNANAAGEYTFSGTLNQTAS